MTAIAKGTYFLFFWLSFIGVPGCESPKNEGINAFDAAADLRAMQSTQGATIGWVTGDSVEYFDWLNGMEQRKISAGPAKSSAEQPKPGNSGSLTPNIPTAAQDVRVSPSGTSAVYRQTDGFYLASSHSTNPSFLLSGKDVQTPLSWSPDSQYLLFVQLDRGASWRKTIACGGDVHLVKIIRVKDLRQATAFPTCEGFPYWVVQWVHVPH